MTKYQSKSTLVVKVKQETMGNSLIKSETVHITLTGVSPLMMNNGASSPNPCDPITKLHKELTSKRKKTDLDHYHEGVISWYQSLYLDAPHSLERVLDTSTQEEGILFTGGHVTQLPPQMLKAAVAEAAKAQRLGTEIKKTFRVANQCPLSIGDSPSDPNLLVKMPKHVDVRPVSIQTKRVMKYRPVFPEWEIKTAIQNYSDKISIAELRDLIEYTGLMVGLGNYRLAKGGSFGAFTITQFDVVR